MGEMKNFDLPGHVTGTSLFLDDLPIGERTLHAAVVDSPSAHGRIKAIRCDAALMLPGVIRLFTHADIPGENQIGGLIPDEPLFAEEEVCYRGQPMGLVVAESEVTARHAARLIEI